jgi:allantoate deiminase
MTDYTNRAEQIFSRIHQLAAISEHEVGITRTFGTDAFLHGSTLVSQWMQKAGLETRMDNIGNVRGVLKNKIEGAKTFVIASHIDTVVNAGKFDGPMGVLMGLDLLEHLIATETSLPFNIELIAFSDEEGVRYHTTYLGSKVVVGSFDDALLSKTDKNGIRLRAVIETMGGKSELLSADAIAAENWLGYYEIHIEQGPVLYESNIPVAIVTAIAGQKRVEITFTGMAGHAGTVPMDMRNDALVSAAQFVLELEHFAIKNMQDLVATVGKLDVVNSASNVIPGKVICSLDLRSADELKLGLAYHAVNKFCQDIADKRGIALDWNLVQETKPVTCDLSLSQSLQNAIEASSIKVVKLVSGAGHDAVPVSQVAPVSMLFVRCFKGISHNPLEDVELTDVAAAIEVSDKFIEELIKSTK